MRIAFFLSIALLCNVPATTWAELTAMFLVEVVDGDTLRVRRNDVRELVRLIGIDAPESRENDRARRQAKSSGQDLATIAALGKAAQAYLVKLLQHGELLRLEFDVERHDKYDRLLAYVYRSDGTFLNERILRDGYAKLLTIPPNIRYEKRFRAAYREARDNERGLWKKKAA